MWALWLANISFKDPAGYIPPAKYPMIHQAVLAACDTVDGLKDGLIDDPTRCHFDPQVLQCKEGDAPSCLTARQVRTARRLETCHHGQRTDRFSRDWSQEPSYAGSPCRGSGTCRSILDYFKYVVFKDPLWDWKTFDLERDAALSNEIDKNTIALQADLTPFAHRGGKLLLYHGWADQQVAPGATVSSTIRSSS